MQSTASEQEQRKAQKTPDPVQETGEHVCERLHCRLEVLPRNSPDISIWGKLENLLSYNLRNKESPQTHRTNCIHQSRVFAEYWIISPCGRLKNDLFSKALIYP
jgi:hypothetical protein